LGYSGTAFYWWWDEHIDKNNLYRIYASISKLLQDVDFSKESFTPQKFEFPAEHVGLRGQNISLLWIKDKPEKLTARSIKLDFIKGVTDAIVYSAEANIELARARNIGKEVYEIRLPATASGEYVLKIHHRTKVEKKK